MRLPPVRTVRNPLLVAVVLAAAAVTMIACSIGVRRDYASIPPGRIGFDDLCGLQDYFDTIEGGSAAAPALVSAVDLENDLGKRVRGGKNRYSFETEFQLKHLRRVLNENWTRLPEPLAAAARIDLEVHWSERSGVKRVVTNTDAEIIIGRESFPLPYQVCLSELLYGEPLYHQRREMSGRQLPSRPLLGDAGIGPAPSPPSIAPAPATTPPVSPDAGTAAPPRAPTFRAAPPAQS